MTRFTVGQVAQICKVAPRTVTKWIDSGRLRGYRIPGSQDRRVEKQALIRFLKEYNMPLGDLDSNFKASIFTFSTLNGIPALLKLELLSRSEEIKISHAKSTFEAGLALSGSAFFLPKIFILDLANLNRDDFFQVLNAIKFKLSTYKEPHWIIVITDESFRDKDISETISPSVYMLSLCSHVVQICDSLISGNIPEKMVLSS